MDAKIAEIKSKFNTAISNGNTVGAAYEHAIESGLDDDVFHAMITGVLDLVEMSTMKATEWLKRTSVPGFPQFIPFKAEEEANEALKESETALRKMQVAFTAAPERKRAREKEGKKKEKKDEAKELARKKTKVGEASNKPGGSNAWLSIDLSP